MLEAAGDESNSPLLVITIPSPFPKLKLGGNKIDEVLPDSDGGLRLKESMEELEALQSPALRSLLLEKKSEKGSNAKKSRKQNLNMTRSCSSFKFIEEEPEIEDVKSYEVNKNTSSSTSRCKHCHKDFLKLTNHRCKVKTVKPAPKFSRCQKFKCCFCQKNFRSDGTYQKHIKTHKMRSQLYMEMMKGPEWGNKNSSASNENPTGISEQ